MLLWSRLEILLHLSFCLLLLDLRLSLHQHLLLLDLYLRPRQHQHHHQHHQHHHQHHQYLFLLDLRLLHPKHLQLWWIYLIKGIQAKHMTPRADDPQKSRLLVLSPPLNAMLVQHSKLHWMCVIGVLRLIRTTQRGVRINPILRIIMDPLNVHEPLQMMPPNVTFQVF